MSWVVYTVLIDNMSDVVGAAAVALRLQQSAERQEILQ